MEHKQLAADRWAKFTIAEQMANIGSEVERTILWKEKKNPAYSGRAFERALELLDLTIENSKSKPRLKELLRLREVLADYFVFDNEYSSSDQLWRNYFYPFNFMARKGR